MALKGTLKDFGIADIFQLIGQQTKTGVLHLNGKEEEVHIWFSDGNVVRAEHQGRRKKDLLGHMLVRAELLSDKQLEEALEEQKRTLKRLGDVLVTKGFVTRDRLRELAQLQTTETLYKLFSWKSGRYEFEQGAVEWDKDSIAPIRGESVLMEGFRMVDEWPLIRKKITSYGMTFERLKDVPVDRSGADEQKEIDDAFGEFGEAAKAQSDKAPKDGIGRNERRVMALADPGRNVQKLVDLSRLGEFETCKSLLNLVNAGYLRAIPPLKEDTSAIALGGDFVKSLRGSAMTFVTRVVMSVLILAALGGVAYSMRLEDIALASGTEGSHFSDPTAQRLLTSGQLTRIRSALQVYRLEKGDYPEGLGDLVAEGLLLDDDLRYPWVEPYFYGRKAEAGGFVLLPPFR